MCAPLSALAVLKRGQPPPSLPVTPAPPQLSTAVTTPSGTPTGSGSTPGSATVPPVAARPTVAGGRQPVPVGGPTGVVWSKPVFREEFTGTTLDTAVWHPGWFGDGVLSGPVETTGHENAAYATDHITVGGGKATFRAGPNTTKRAVDGRTYLNVGSQITSDPLQGATTGYLSPGVDYYVECSAQLPAGNFGPHSLPLASFWQDTQTWPAGFEIDIFEAAGTDSSSWRVHYPQSPGSSTQITPAPGGSTTVPGATTGFHSYGALIEGARAGLPTGRISFYYDGSLAGSVTPTLPVADLGRYLVLGVSAGGRIALPHDVYAVFDYVRVWTYTGTPSVTRS